MPMAPTIKHDHKAIDDACATVGDAHARIKAEGASLYTIAATQAVVVLNQARDVSFKNFIENSAIIKLAKAMEAFISWRNRQFMIRGVAMSFK